MDAPEWRRASFGYLMQIEQDLDHFKARFQALSKEAQGFGVNAVVILASEDPLANSFEIAWFTHGSRIMALGMVSHTEHQLQSKSGK